MLTLPNFLTLLRIIAIPIFLVLLTEHRYAVAFIVFMSAGITDAIDGAIARITHTKSHLGAVLDPTADKLLLLSSFIVLALQDAVPHWLVALAVSRDVIVVFGFLILTYVHGDGPKIQPTRLGKVNTFFELFTIGFVLMFLARPFLPLAHVIEIIQGITAATIAASGAQYVYQGLLWHQRRVADGS